MTKLLFQVFILAINIFYIVHAHAAETTTKIAFVNTQRILQEAAPVKAAQSKLEQEFAKRDNEIRDMVNRYKTQSGKLEKERLSLSASNQLERHRKLAELDKEIQRRQREFREDLDQRKNEELAIVLERTNKVIQDLAKKEGYDIVFQDAVYVKSGIDITDKVLAALKKTQ